MPTYQQKIAGIAVLVILITAGLLYVVQATGGPPVPAEIKGAVVVALAWCGFDVSRALKNQPLQSKSSPPQAEKRG